MLQRNRAAKTGNKTGCEITFRGHWGKIVVRMFMALAIRCSSLTFSMVDADSPAIKPMSTGESPFEKNRNISPREELKQYFTIFCNLRSFVQSTEHVQILIPERPFEKQCNFIQISIAHRLNSLKIIKAHFITLP